MKTIFKYPIEITDIQTVKLPKGAVIRNAHMQNGSLYLWVEVDPHAPKEDRRIEVFGTGHHLHEDMGISREYIGTVHDSPFVWHVYESTGI